jgi:Mn-dependent DtxR family transcriptional regulator
MNNKLVEFRKILAEQGKELTLDQAKVLYISAEKLLKRSKKLSQIDLWNMQDEKIEGMTEKEKQEAIALYQYIRDLV